jgi:ABC-type bacteriocin/lantibiotic exporter with double-glycine peptidase domain
MNQTTSPPNEVLENIGFHFEHVAFRYGSSEPDVIHDFTTTIMPNTCSVIVGESGSGKSTLLSLALGLNRPTNGNVYLIDSNQKKIPLDQMQSHLLQKVGYVGPESYLIEGTIRENLLYGLSRDPSQPEIDLALEAAECGFIQNLKGGLGHHITEQGQGLSAGQKQRLSFARALLRNPKVLVLDEATSNLDAETEERLLRTIERLKGKVTILAVTHRDAVRRISDQTLEIGKK